MEEFWVALVSASPSLGYLALGECPHLRTRAQVRHLLRPFPYTKRFLVVDFEHVHFISQAAAHELLVQSASSCALFVHPINVSEQVAGRLRAVQRASN